MGHNTKIIWKIQQSSSKFVSFYALSLPILKKEEEAGMGGYEGCKIIDVSHEWIWNLIHLHHKNNILDHNSTQILFFSVAVGFVI